MFAVGQNLNSINALLGAFFGVVFMNVMRVGWRFCSAAALFHSHIISHGMTIDTQPLSLSSSAHLMKNALQSSESL